MSEVSRGPVASSERNKISRDYFGFYTHEIAEFLSENDDFLPSSSGMSEASGRTSGVVGDDAMTQYGYNGKNSGGFSSSSSLFSDGVGTGLSDFKREKLKALLRETVIVLTKEVDEMADPVLAMQQLKAQLRSKNCIESYSAAASHGDDGQCPRKKLKTFSSPSFTSIPECESNSEGSGSKDVDSKSQDVPLSVKGQTNAVKKKCSTCNTTESSHWKSVSEGSKTLCRSCWGKYKGIHTESFLGSNMGADKGHDEVNMSTDKENGEVKTSTEKGKGEGSGSKDVDSKSQDVPLSVKGRTNAVKKKCSTCNTTQSSRWKSVSEGSKTLCRSCWGKYKGIHTESFLGSNMGADKGHEEVNMSTDKENGEVKTSKEKGNGEVGDDLKFLLESDSSLVEEIMKKHSDDLLKTLGYMEKQLEELLDAVISQCRTMTLTEKQKLQNLIQKLPPKKHDRILEIVERDKLPKSQSCKDIHVDLEKESNATLWQLYFYVEAVENARKLSTEFKPRDHHHSSS